MSPHDDRLSRGFHCLLRLYPKEYRERYAVEMEDVFRRDAERRGAGVAFWLSAVGDHLEAAWYVRRRGRSQTGEGRMTRMMDDFRAAVRSLRRAPRFVLFAVGTLAFGVGAVTAVFSVVERVVIRPLPYPESERMMLIGIDPRHDPGSLGPLSPALLAALRDRPGPADAVVAGRGREAVLRVDGDPERVRLTEVSEDFFPVFGASATVGRLLHPADHAPDAGAVVVLGHATWRDRFGADADVIGRAVRFDDEVHTVVGVVSADFHPPPEITEVDDFWVPLRIDDSVTGSFSLAGLARLRPGVAPGELDAHADAVVRAVYEGDSRPSFLLGASVAGYRESLVGHVARNLNRVLGAVMLLLIIACVNVASLMLTRGAQRRHELGVHYALGAPRGRLVSKLLAESALLAAGGVTLGGLLAWWVVELFRRYAPPGLPRLAEVAVDGRGFGFAVAVGAVTVVLFGLLPALRTTRSVRGGGRASRGATVSRGETRIRGALVTAETALAVVLAVGSGLLAHDLIRVTREDPGFRPEGLVAMTLNLQPRYERSEWASVWERLVESAEALPGAASAAVATQAPWDGSRVASTYRPEGWEGEEGAFVIYVAVGGDYLETLGAELVAGRALTEADGDGEPVMLVNETFASQFWPGEEAVGKLVHSGQEDEPTYRVVGVLADVSTGPGRSISPHAFHPLSEAPWREMEVLVRVNSDAPAGMATALRDMVRTFDPNLPVTSIHTMASLSSVALAGPRFYAVLFASFAGLALLLAIVGVYGTTAYSTRSRLREAGIRLALGARQEQVVGALVVPSGLAVALGIALGLAGAAAGANVLAETLRHVQPRDGLTYAMVGITVAATGLVAAWLPARVASRTDPMRTLREE
ncbi:MAG: FtsX-like permease family protein [Gemmatimonadetes bacterium]|nr:FtsX-like permease family protein [Gemmatimonadota bacterium]